MLYEGACIIKAPSGGGEQDMLCLPLEYLNGWLFGIDERRVIPGFRVTPPQASPSGAIGSERHPV